MSTQLAPNFSSPGVGVFIEKPRYRRKERINPEGNERVAQVSHNWLDASGYFLPNLLRRKILFSSRCLHIYIYPLCRDLFAIFRYKLFVNEFLKKKKKKISPAWNVEGVRKSGGEFDKRYQAACEGFRAGTEDENGTNDVHR